VGRAIRAQAVRHPPKASIRQAHAELTSLSAAARQCTPRFWRHRGRGALPTSMKGRATHDQRDRLSLALAKLEVGVRPGLPVPRLGHLGTIHMDATGPLERIARVAFCAGPCQAEVHDLGAALSPCLRRRSSRISASAVMSLGVRLHHASSPGGPSRIAPCAFRCEPLPRLALDQLGSDSRQSQPAQLDPRPCRRRRCS
jgi:hypothetical protein